MNYGRSPSLILTIRPPNFRTLPSSIEPAASPIAAVADGEVTVYWGAALGQGQSIVAYEKNAPTAGGWVLLQDRTVKQLSAEEFQSAAKAGK